MSLPNRYAVAGQCEQDGCEALFCNLHWSSGNKRCGQHEIGGMPSVQSQEESKVERGEKVKEDTMAGEKDQELVKRAPKRVARKAMGEVLNMVKTVGSNATGLLARLKKDKSPEAMLATLDEQAGANAKRREGVSARAEKSATDIVAKKADRESASPARRRILELELRNLLHDYQAAERELKVLLENERTISKVRGRFLEVLAYDLRGVTEDQVDGLVDLLDEKVGEADDISGALDDLDKAGRRREPSGAAEEDLDAMLAEFDQELSGGAARKQRAEGVGLDDFKQTSDPSPEGREELDAEPGV
ncbi:MAG: hypothetical protein ACI87O_001158 [Planctomycetota bacterium]|jgi:hypothetical protein